ncbi:MFS general substrate transporter [Xylariaceae sp. FL0016]|nr:MFS general substrate transporter [Xylariaceae sp. FL0016]
MRNPWKAQSQPHEKPSGDLEGSPPAKDQADAPPDGGLRAWTQVLFLHIVFFNTWGVANGFGVFQEYYSSTLGQSQSAISWVGSVQVFFLFSIGVATGRATDAGHFRIIFTLGVFLQVLGLFMLSLSTTYWQIFLAQAVCLGIGNGCTFCPALAIMSSYFKRKRAIAVGLASAGAGCGGLIYPVVLDQLIHLQGFGGFPWAVRIMGFIMLATYIPCVIWFTPRLPPQKTGPLVDTSAFTEATFILFSLSMFFNFWGLYFAFFYMGTFARDRIGVAQPITLLLVLNGVGVVGRILPNIVADRIGALNVLIPLSFAASLVLYCWVAVHTTGALYGFAVLYGLLAAALQALFPAVATTMTPDLSRTGTRVGMIFSFVSFATLTGPAISGALIQKRDGDYLYAQLFAGTSVLIGALFAVAAKVSLARTEHCRVY